MKRKGVIEPDDHRPQGLPVALQRISGPWHASAGGSMHATFELEANEIQLGNGPVVGIDEAGRGPWAGPVVAAAVILNPARIPDGIADSKSLTAEDRDHLDRAIRATARIGVGIADVARIDRDNILQATLWAMVEAVRAVTATPGQAPRLALIDGNRAPRLAIATRTLVKGDARCLSIAAASIVAKVARDRLMVDMAQRYPGYGFERHKGYGTPEHQAAIDALGVTPEHRRSFKPVQLALV
jgi:ribonuclease HII